MPRTKAGVNRGGFDQTFCIYALLPWSVSYPGNRRVGGRLLSARPGVIRSHRHRCGSDGCDPAHADPIAGAKTAATLAYSPGLVNRSRRNLLQYDTPEGPNI
jgi:hypothetical protein